VKKSPKELFRSAASSLTLIPPDRLSSPGSSGQPKSIPSVQQSTAKRPSSTEPGIRLGPESLSNHLTKAMQPTAGQRDVRQKMFRDWKSLILGMLAGVILSSGIFYLLSSRYKVSSSGPQGMMTIRTDTWTGKTWMARYYNINGGSVWYWQPMEERK
jgi:hypothetical protein